MKFHFFHRNRLLWLVFILLLSFALVGVALASASAVGRSIQDGIDPQSQANQVQHRAGTLPPSPVQVLPEKLELYSSGDSLGEQMRQQVMSDSRSIRSDAQVANLASGDVFQSSSMALQGAGTMYLPDGFVVDTYIDSIYGYTTSWADIVVTRSDGAYGSAEADEMGFFWLTLYTAAGTGEPVDILEGDILEIDVNGSVTQYTVGPEMFGEMEVGDDIITGTIPGDTGGTEVTLALGSYGMPDSAYCMYTATTATDGSFVMSFVGLVNLGPEHFISADYMIGGIYQRSYLFPQNAFLIMQHGTIAGYAELWSEVTVTVFEGDTSIIRDGPYTTNAGYPYGWFNVDHVTMAVGDRVEVEFTTGTAEVFYVYASSFGFPDGNIIDGNISLPDTEVRISFSQWDDLQHDYAYYEASDTSNGDGYFTASFPVDIRPETRIEVAVLDPSGPGSVMFTGKPYVEAIITFESDYDCVAGRVDAPNTDVTFNLIRGTDVYTRDLGPSDPGNIIGDFRYCYLMWHDFGDGQGSRPLNFETGDIISLSTAGDTWETTIVEPHVVPNTIDNYIELLIFSGETGEVAVRVSPSDNAFFSQAPAFESHDLASTNEWVLFPFPDFDIRSGIFIDEFFYDPATRFANHFTERNHYFQTVDNIGVRGLSSPTEQVTLLLWQQGNPEPIYVSSEDVDPDPAFFYFDLRGFPLQPGYIVQVDYEWHETGDQTLTYLPVSVQGDVGSNLITGLGRDGMLEFTAGFDGVSIDQMAPSIASQAVISTSFFGYDLWWGDSTEMTYLSVEGNKQVATNMMGEMRRVQFWINPDNQTWLWGTARPGYDVNIETSQGYTTTGWADPLYEGDFSTSNSVHLEPYDSVTVLAGQGDFPTDILLQDIWANSDSAHNTVFGRIGLPFHPVEIYPWWDENEPMTTTLTDELGNFSVTFPRGVPPQARGHIRFEENDIGDNAVDAVFHRPFYDIDPSLSVNYAHDWVESQYDPGVSVAITVTDNTEAIKATAHGQTGPIEWWGNETGFSTSYNVPWDTGMQPDIQAGDLVFLQLGNGRAEQVQLGEINGVLDIDTDTFDGLLNIPWLVDPVRVDCGAWIENGPGFDVGEVDPNGGTFTCDFASVGFDLIAGMDVGVSYHEDQADQVINVFQEPAPHMYIWLEDFGPPALGNNYMLRLHFNNDGWATATNMTISQEFVGMTYLGDTSPYPHTGTGAPGDPVIWQVGDLPYNHQNEIRFDVFVHIDEASIFTSGAISTDMPYYQGDPWSMLFEWAMDLIGENDAQLNIGKWAWTWAPVPGHDFVYAVNVCNNGSTSSSDVYITDTLPVTTTVVGWFAQQPGWVEVSQSAQELVVMHPTIPSGRCSEVYLTAHLETSAWPGMKLYNDAQVWSASDTTPDDNWAHMDHQAAEPEYNLHLDPNWVQGQFVPGGEVSFEINFSNWGNLPMPGTVLTATVPEGTEFLSAYTWDWSSSYDFPPTVIGDGFVRWDIGEFPNGYNQGVGIRLLINSDTPVGTPLEVRYSIAGDHLEYRYDDNVWLYLEEVNGYGSNLRVDKHTGWWWNDWYEGDVHMGQLNYELRILNLSTQYLVSPTITDTYPIATEVDACWWNHGPVLRCDIDPDNHQVVYTLNYLNPGETASAMLRVNLDPDAINQQGVAYVNHAEISDFNDITPEDNQDTLTSYTGPDAFVRKWLKDGIIQAGRTVTYTVEFGNLNRWPWPGDWGYGSHITETLPEGMTFVDAFGYWDYGTSWEPESINGQQVVWVWDRMWPTAAWTFDLVVEIDSDVLPGTELLNTIEAWGDGPDEVDYNPANNTFEYTLTTLMYRILMPFMLKYP